MGVVGLSHRVVILYMNQTCCWNPAITVLTPSWDLWSCGSINHLPLWDISGWSPVSFIAALNFLHILPSTHAHNSVMGLPVTDRPMNGCFGKHGCTHCVNLIWFIEICSKLYGLIIYLSPLAGINDQMAKTLFCLLFTCFLLASQIPLHRHTITWNILYSSTVLQCPRKMGRFGF